VTAAVGVCRYGFREDAEGEGYPRMNANLHEWEEYNIGFVFKIPLAVIYAFIRV